MQYPTCGGADLESRNTLVATADQSRMRIFAARNNMSTADAWTDALDKFVEDLDPESPPRVPITTAGWRDRSKSVEMRATPATWAAITSYREEHELLTLEVFHDVIEHYTTKGR